MVTFSCLHHRHHEALLLVPAFVVSVVAQRAEVAFLLLHAVAEQHVAVAFAAENVEQGQHVGVASLAQHVEQEYYVVIVPVVRCTSAFPGQIEVVKPGVAAALMQHRDLHLNERPDLRRVGWQQDVRQHGLPDFPY